MTRDVAAPRQARASMPPRKPLDEHKQPMTVTLQPENRRWLRDHYQELGYRSESHAVDDAIRLLKETKEKEKGGR